jgi:glycosyltransferase involved in cell wall biosynthesis
VNRDETIEWMNRISLCETALFDRDIVLLSHQRWDEHTTPIHGTTLRLAQRNRVLYVEPPDSFGWIVSYLRESDHRHSAARRALKHSFNRLERFGSNFSVYHTPPIFLPAQARSKLVLKTMDIGYRHMIAEGIRLMGLVDPIFWVIQFNAVGAVQAMKPELVVYQCVEEAAEFVEGDRLKNYVRTMDRKMCEFADTVIVPNPHILDARRSVCRDIHMLPWAADVELFNQAMDPDVVVPDEIDKIKKPIVGIYANIDVRRFSVDFLVNLARRRPKWSFVLIGRILPDFDPKKLRCEPNIHLIGQQPLADLPRFVKAFDVCMIPYEVNAFTRSITPIKLAEYLATGRPVVTTDLPAAHLYEDVVHIAGNLDEFECHIATAMNDTPELREQRLAAAKQQDWHQYMRRVTDIVAGVLQPPDHTVVSDNELSHAT